MESNDKIEITSSMYNNDCDKKVKQCCIIENIKFNSINEISNGIILTPICEIHQKKADYLIIAQIIPLKNFFETFLIEKNFTDREIVGLDRIDNKRIEKVQEQFREKYLKNKTYRFHFITDNEDKFGYSIIDFNSIESIKIKDFEKYNKICEILHPWNANIISRFTAYCVRFGIDDLSNDFYEEVFNKISLLKKNG